MDAYEFKLKCMRRQRELNALEKAYRKEKGVHPAFPWSMWGDRPRGGAIWTEPELDSIAVFLNERFDGKTKLEIEVFAELAWLHGRSANAVYEKLVDFMGWKQFNRTFWVIT